MAEAVTKAVPTASTQFADDPTPVEAIYYDTAERTVPEQARDGLGRLLIVTLEGVRAPAGSGLIGNPVIEAVKRQFGTACRAIVRSHNETTDMATLLIHHGRGRRSTKENVPYGPGKPGHWGWPEIEQ